MTVSFGRPSESRETARREAKKASPEVEITPELVARVQTAYREADRPNWWRTPTTTREVDSDGVKAMLKALHRMGLLAGGECPQCGCVLVEGVKPAMNGRER